MLGLTRADAPLASLVWWSLCGIAAPGITARERRKVKLRLNGAAGVPVNVHLSGAGDAEDIFHKEPLNSVDT